MKRFTSYLTLALACVSLTTAPLLSGCATQATSGRTVAYRTLKATGEGVDSAMKGFAKATVDGLVPANIQVDVSNAHERYRVAFAVALKAARFDVTAPAPDNVIELATQLTSLIATYVH